MYILLDIGGTTMRIGSAEDSNTVENIHRLPTPANFDEAIAIIKSTIHSIAGSELIEKIIVGVPGPLNASKTEMESAANLLLWNHHPLQKIVAEEFSTTVQLENDAALAGLGEAVFGAGADKKIVVYLTVSTGIGGVRIVNKKIEEASIGFEPGHHVIVMDGEVCSCGGKGHLEAYASGTSVEKKYGKPPREVAQTADWEDVMKYLAVGINNTIAFWSPDIIILGGSMSKDIHLEMLMKHLTALKPVFKTLPPIVKSKLGDENGLYGGLALARA